MDGWMDICRAAHAHAFSQHNNNSNNNKKTTQFAMMLNESYMKMCVLWSRMSAALAARFK